MQDIQFILPLCVGTHIHTQGFSQDLKVVWVVARWGTTPTACLEPALGTQEVVATEPALLEITLRMHY